MANLKPRRIDPNASVDEFLIVFAKNIEDLKLWLADGWSIEYSKKKSGITAFYHKRLLKCPEYAALIYRYRQFSTRTVKILNDEIEKRKQSMI